MHDMVVNVWRALWYNNIHFLLPKCMLVQVKLLYNILSETKYTMHLFQLCPLCACRLLPTRCWCCWKTAIRLNNTRQQLCYMYILYIYYLHIICIYIYMIVHVCLLPNKVWFDLIWLTYFYFWAKNDQIWQPEARWMIFLQFTNRLQFHFWLIFCGQKVNFKWRSYQAVRPLVSTLDSFLKNGSVTFSLFWHEPSQGWYYSTTQSWIWLNRSKGHFSRSERSKFATFLQFWHLLSIYSKSDQ